MIRSSSLGTTCHRDEDLFIRYKDSYRMMMTNRGGYGIYDDIRKVEGHRISKYRRYNS